MKNFTLLLISVIALFFFSCTGKNIKNGDAKIISVTIEPQRYVVEKLAGDKFKVNCVVPSGQSPETYDPSPQEMINISHSSAYLRIGEIGFEQAWIKSITENNPSMPVYDLSAGVNLIKNEEHNHHEPCEHNNHEHHHGQNDPHIWTSVRNMKIISKNVLDALVAIDKENETYYKENYSHFAGELDRLESELDSLLVSHKGKSFIIYHPALTYLAADYGMKQLCIEIDGKEPTPAQLKKLIETAKESGARIVFVQKEFDRKSAEVIANETGCKLIQINPLDYDWEKEIKEIAKALSYE